MSGTRLTQALHEGMVSLAEGETVVWGARADMDLSGLPSDAILVSTFRPDHDALLERGHRVVSEAPKTCASAVVFLPRYKELARTFLAEASEASTGPIVVDGQKAEGIESVLRDLRRKHPLSAALSKSHGKLAVLEAGADLSDWADAGPQRTPDGFFLRAGVFSADGPDPGSRLLADALPRRLGSRVVDLGAGWGYLARSVLDREGVAEVHLVEADLRAIECARLAITDPRARFHWADATRFADADGFDTAVANPPFHVTRDADPGLGQAFVVAASRLLKPGGQLWLVANRHLPYERALTRHFGEVSELAGDGSYKLFRAARPNKRQGAIA